MTQDGMSVEEVLLAAADLIEPEGKWTRGAEARDINGNPRLGDEREAVRWCLIGAVRKVGGAGAQDQVRPALRKVMRGNPWDWNDRKNRTQAEVVAKLREAALRSRASSAQIEGAE